MSNDYSVKKGDTLWGIANHHGLTVKQLADWNSLQGRHVHDLKIGQLIHLKPINQTDDVELELTIKLLDLAFEPIKKATLRLEYDSKTRTENITNGQISNLLIEDHSKGLKVYFKNITGTFDLIADHKRLPVGRKTLTLTSRAVKVKGTYAAQEGVVHRTINTIQRELKGIHDAILNPPQSPPPPQSDDHETKPEHKSVSTPAPVKQDTPKQKTSTTTAQTAPQPKASVPPPPKVPSAEVKPINQTMRTDGGEHTHVVAVQFTEDNLLLKKENNIYRKYIIETAKRYGFTPQGMAALINAEAAKLKGGEWNPKSYNSDSNAGGMTQFLKGTWLDMCKKQSSLVGHYVCSHPKLSDSKKLELRFNPEFAIDAAANYANSNFKILKNRNLPVDKITDPAGRAKLAYLLHHEGAPGAYQFIMNTIAPDRAQKILFLQFGQKQKARAEAYLKRYKGDAKVAYGHWLRNYVDKTIILSQFTGINPNSSVDEMSLDDVIVQLGGVSLGGSKPTPKPNTQNTQEAKVAEKTNPPSVNSTKQTTSPKESTVVDSKLSGQGVGGSNVWHNPLAFDKLRTARLASVKGATFGMVRSGGTRPHQGIDLIAEPGTDIYSVAAGVVVAVRRAFTDFGGKSYGATIVLEVLVDNLPEPQKSHAKKFSPSGIVWFFYAHLSAINVEVKDQLEAGVVLGKSGCSGNAGYGSNPMNTIAKGAHLHFEVWNVKNHGDKGGLDCRFDPLPFIADLK